MIGYGSNLCKVVITMILYLYDSVTINPNKVLPVVWLSMWDISKSLTHNITLRVWLAVEVKTLILCVWTFLLRRQFLGLLLTTLLHGSEPAIIVTNIQLQLSNPKTLPTLQTVVSTVGHNFTPTPGCFKHAQIFTRRLSTRFFRILTAG